MKFKHTQETKNKISISNLGEDNGMWKGKRVGIISLHQWIKYHKEKSLICEDCKKEKVLELANIDGNYDRNLDNYKWLCRSCHMKFDYKNKIRIGKGKSKQSVQE